MHKKKSVAGILSKFHTEKEKFVFLDLSGPRLTSTTQNK